jgi:hypothetical protein
LRRSQKAIHLFTLLAFLYGTAGVHLIHPHPHHLFDFFLGQGPPTVKSFDTTTISKTHKQCSICTLLASLPFCDEPRAEIAPFTVPYPVLADTLSIDIPISSEGSPNPRAPPLDAL